MWCSDKKTRRQKDLVVIVVVVILFRWPLGVEMDAIPRRSGLLFGSPILSNSFTVGGRTKRGSIVLSFSSWSLVLLVLESVVLFSSVVVELGTALLHGTPPPFRVGSVLL